MAELDVKIAQLYDEIVEKFRQLRDENRRLRHIFDCVKSGLLHEIDADGNRIETPELNNAYELPIGTEIVIGKRRWKLRRKMNQHPDMMRFLETTTDEPEPISRVMYPSEVQALIDAGFKVILPDAACGKEQSNG